MPLLAPILPALRDIAIGLAILGVAVLGVASLALVPVSLRALGMPAPAVLGRCPGTPLSLLRMRPAPVACGAAILAARMPMRTILSRP